MAGMTIFENRTIDQRLFRIRAVPQIERNGNILRFKDARGRASSVFIEKKGYTGYSETDSGNKTKNPTTAVVAIRKIGVRGRGL
jgi:hypothetical protein